jgi:predicted secreted hydrolase
MKRASIPIIGVFLIGMGALILWSIRPQKGQTPVASLPLTTGDFTQAQEGRVFEFPKDHGPHPDFQTEWWYYTGNLYTATNRHFSYQLTFFRRSIMPVLERQSRQSAWATDQIYLAHFALRDGDENDFRYFQRIQRGAAGLAGAEVDPHYRVWLENWSVEQTTAGDYRLYATDDDIQIELNLSDLKGPVLQGNEGYSQKGPDTGNASHYYSQTRLKTTGKIEINKNVYPIEGYSWMDHEFSTSALSADQVGWDWFSIQLDDNTEIMLFNIRKQDLSIDPFSAGTIIQKDGNTIPLGYGDFDISVLRQWRSPHSSAQYPSVWEIRIPGQNLMLSLEPYQNDQELNLSFTYWEGAVKISGEKNGLPIKGDGFVELTGYAGSMQGQF